MVEAPAAAQNIDTDWDYVQTPIGRVTMPGFDKARALTDEELAQELNTCAFIDPAMITEAQRRPGLSHWYEQGQGWIWGPTQKADPANTVTGPARLLVLNK